MIMRVGGRFPYLQEPESIFAVQAKGRGEYVAMCVCVFSQFVSACIHVCKHKELRYLMDSQMSNQNTILSSSTNPC